MYFFDNLNIGCGRHISWCYQEADILMRSIFRQDYPGLIQRPTQNSLLASGVNATD